MSFLEGSTLLIPVPASLPLGVVSRPFATQESIPRSRATRSASMSIPEVTRVTFNVSDPVGSRNPYEQQRLVESPAEALDEGKTSAAKLLILGLDDRERLVEFVEEDRELVGVPRHLLRREVLARGEEGDIKHRNLLD